MAVLFFLLSSALANHPQDGPDVDVRIRIEDRRVVFQLMMNLAFIDEIVEVPREQEDDLHPVELPGVRDALFAYYKTHNRVRIDGIDVIPVLEGCEMPPPDHKLLPLFPEYGMKALVKVGIELAYPCKSPPRSVATKWGPFPPNTVMAIPGEEPPPVDVTAQILAQGEQQIVFFLKEEPEYVWHRSEVDPDERFMPVPKGSPPPPRLAVPVVSVGILVALFCWGAMGLCFRNRGRSRRYGVGVIVGLVGVAAAWPFARVEVQDPFSAGDVLPTAAEAQEIFRPLHANIYRAFDYTGESEIYDALARSVHGDLLDDLYNEIYRSLIMQDEGGAVSRVEAVRMLEAEVEHIGATGEESHPGFSILARWQVDGAVFHWGHSHHRTNEYQARYNVVRAAEGWRIAGSQTIESTLVGASVPERATPDGGK